MLRSSLCRLHIYFKHEMNNVFLHNIFFCYLFILTYKWRFFGGNTFSSQDSYCHILNLHPVLTILKNVIFTKPTLKTVLKSQSRKALHTNDKTIHNLNIALSLVRVYRKKCPYICSNSGLMDG